MTGTHHDGLAELVAKLEQIARDAGCVVLRDGWVDERTAALLLERVPGTLRNWRAGRQPLAYRRIGGPRGRVTYNLQELARHLLESESAVHESARKRIDASQGVVNDEADIDSSVKVAS